MSRSDGKPGTVVDNSTMLDDKPERHRKRELDDLPTMSRDRYAITNEHARGGLGVILAARDEHLGRTVAIKELGAGADERMSTRFVREALITARLQHPGIVPVYEAGKWPTGARFYAMKMVSGKTLREELKARASLEERLALVPNVLAVAEAVAYAHSQGVIHRDLKPDNVMVGAFGETVVVDWGLAKDLKLGVEIAPDKSGLYAQSHAEATRIGAVIGTPAYMSPEQARGEDVDERADVWAIGAILYHLLTAAPPYSGAPDSVIERVAKDPAPRVDDQVTGAPRDLVAIVDKAMARDPAERYANAKELAVDLSLFLTGQLVGAREYSRLAILEHWIRRHRAPVIVGAVLTAILAIGATLSISRILGERRTARARSDELVLTQARSQLDRDPTAALAWLKQYPAGGAEPEVARNIAEDAASRGVARHVWGHPDTITSMVLSPDGKTVATASGNLLQAFDRASGLRSARVEFPTASYLVKFFSDGQRLAAAAQDGTISIVDLGTQKARMIGKISNLPKVVEISSDLRAVVVGGDDGSVVAFDVAGGPGRELLKHAEGQVLAMALADGGVVVVALVNDTLLIDRVTLATPPVTESLASLTVANAVDPKLSPDGRTMVIGVAERVMRWDVGSTALVEVARQRTPITFVAISPSKHILAGGTDGTITSIIPGSEPRNHVGHYHPIKAFAFSRDERTFASGDLAGNINVWTSTGVEPRPGHGNLIQALEFADDGDLVSASDDAGARVWPASRSRPVFQVGTSDVFRVVWLSPTRLVSTGRDRIVSMIDLDGRVKAIDQEEKETYSTIVLPNGNFVASTWDGEIVVFSPDGIKKQRFHHRARVWLVASSPDGRQLASCGTDGVVKLWTIDTGEMREIDKHANVDALSAAFSPDGKMLATSAGDHDVRVIDLTSSSPPIEFKGHKDDPISLTWSADSTTVYSAGADGDVRAWNVVTRKSEVFGGHESFTRTIALSQDQRYLASGGNDGVVIVWDLADSNHAQRTLRGFRAEVRDVTFAPTGHTLAAAGWDGTVRLWNLDANRVTIWRGHEGKVQHVAFSPDGKYLASSAEDGRVRVWTVADQTAIPSDSDGFEQWLSSATTARTATGRLEIMTPN